MAADVVNKLVFSDSLYHDINNGKRDSDFINGGVE